METSHLGPFGSRSAVTGKEPRSLNGDQKDTMAIKYQLFTGWSRSPCGSLLFRHVVKNDESYWGSIMLSLLSV
jgi:hypothetical protein